MKLTLLRSLFAGIALLSMSAIASATMIDQFDAPPSPGQFGCTTSVPGTPTGCPTSTPNLAIGLGTGTIGGQRSLAIGVPGNGTVQVNVNGVFQPNRLNIASDSGADPIVTLTYSGLGVATPANLIANGETLLHTRYWSDLGFNMVVTINGTPVAFVLPGATVSAGTDFFFALSNWSNRASFNNVTSMSILFNGGAVNGADGWFDFFETATPEPMTFAMMGAGLLALGALRLRKRS
jgi:hypothetical protein